MAHLIMGHGVSWCFGTKSAPTSIHTDMLEIAVCEARNEQRIREVVGVHLAGQLMMPTFFPIALACLIRSPAMFGINGSRHLKSINDHHYHSQRKTRSHIRSLSVLHGMCAMGDRPTRAQCRSDENGLGDLRIRRASLSRLV